LLTERDREIISFIDKIGYATIQNIASMYFSENKFSYDLARKRLKKIKEFEGYIKSFQNSETNETIYVPYNSNKKKVSIHDVMVLNYACKLKVIGCTLYNIELEPTFCNIKPDALVQYTINGYKYHQLVEMQIRHNLIDLDRYNKQGVMESILSKTNNTLPTLIIIQDTKINYADNNPTPMDIVQMDTTMWDIGKVLIQKDDD
jgi:hypothetical protein